MKSRIAKLRKQIAEIEAAVELEATKMPAGAGLEFMCDARRITLTNKQLIIDDANGRRETPLGRDPLAIADERFVEAIRNQDPTRVVCSYTEAVGTQALCCAVRDITHQENPS